jgi:bile acid:Na+ symporter, BASS family
MSVSSDRVVRLAQFAHHHLLGLILFSYVAAAVFPAVGLWMRSVHVGGSLLPAAVSLPSALLAFLLFSAGLGVNAHRLWALARRPALLVLGMGANLVLPVGFILATASIMQSWHNPREVQEILVGLVLSHRGFNVFGRSCYRWYFEQDRYR